VGRGEQPWRVYWPENGHTVYLWCYEQDVTKCIEARHINDRYLPRDTAITINHVNDQY